jgi:hypothetical protein
MEKSWKSCKKMCYYLFDFFEFRIICISKFISYGFSGFCSNLDTILFFNNLESQKSANQIPNKKKNIPLKESWKSKLKKLHNINSCFNDFFDIFWVLRFFGSNLDTILFFNNQKVYTQIGEFLNTKLSKQFAKPVFHCLNFADLNHFRSKLQQKKFLI